MAMENLVRNGPSKVTVLERALCLPTSSRYSSYARRELSWPSGIIFTMMCGSRNRLRLTHALSVKYKAGARKAISY